jgi:prefoldin subunit 5
MDHPRTDAERDLERDTEELEHRIEELEGHIESAEKELDVRSRDESTPVDDAAGDWEDKSKGAQRGG